MIKQTAFFLLGLAACMNIGLSQEELEVPTSADTKNYKEAYDLLFDSQSRARKALGILLKDGSSSPEDLNDRELSLLCHVYNELGDRTNQLIVASVLWNRDPGSRMANSLMSSSLLLKLSSAAGVEEVVAFVDDAIKRNIGNRRKLLILKAKAVLSKKNITDARKRLEVIDLLVEAYTCDPLPKDELNFGDADSPNYIVDEYSFASFFSDSERRTIKERMILARKEAEIHHKN